MPDRLLRDQGILSTLRENGLLKKTLLVEIGKFQLEKPRESDLLAKFSPETEFVNIESIPFIGAGINFDRIQRHNKHDINVVWIRLGELTQLDL